MLNVIFPCSFHILLDPQAQRAVDVNPVYGVYYYEDGGRRRMTAEVEQRILPPSDTPTVEHITLICSLTQFCIFIMTREGIYGEI